jgi:hypothetical protein
MVREVDIRGGGPSFVKVLAPRVLVHEKHNDWLRNGYATSA